MVNLLFIFLSPLIFVLLWRFIEKCPELFARISAWLYKNGEHHDLLKSVLVFSAATANSGEAEFIDERPIAKRRLIWLFRALLVLSYLFFVLYMLHKP